MSPLPPAVHPATLEECWALIDRLFEIVHAQQAQITKLEARVQELERRLGQNSQNSSRPPSTDPLGLKRPPKKPPSGRSPGGQPGHEGHQRALVPADQLTSSTECYPDKCGRCARKLDPRRNREVGDSVHHQVTEIPEVTPQVADYLRHALECTCGHVTLAPLPAGVPEGGFGPRLQATIAWLSGTCRLGKRTIASVLADLFRVEIGLGSVSACEQRVSDAVAAPVAEAHAAIQEQPVLHADETGWRQRRQRAWLWVAVSVTLGVAVFQVHWGRGKKAAQELLGRFAGWLVTDRWCAYEHYPLERRQLCWAHLLRHFRAMKEYRGTVGRLGAELVTLSEQMFRWWHRVRDGTLTRATFRRKMAPARERIEWLILDGTQTRTKAVRAMCWELHRLSAAMWTFIDVEGIDPTNNAAERAVRAAVLWRKCSYVTHSEAGGVFAERMLTVTASLRMQSRNVLAYLTHAVEASLSGQAAPSLLPGRDHVTPLANAA
mgnify:CR=1 FL=1